MCPRIAERQRGQRHRSDVAVPTLKLRLRLNLQLQLKLERTVAVQRLRRERTGGRALWFGWVGGETAPGC